MPHRELWNEMQMVGHPIVDLLIPEPGSDLFVHLLGRWIKHHQVAPIFHGCDIRVRRTPIIGDNADLARCLKLAGNSRAITSCRRVPGHVLDRVRLAGAFEQSDRSLIFVS